MWQEVISSKIFNQENVVRIIKNVLRVSIPMSLCSLFSASTKTIDALTVVRILKRIIGEETATVQYGILNGKVDTLVMLPLSFNIAFATALVPAISSAVTRKKIEDAKKRIEFSILISLLIGLPCSVLMSTFSEYFLKLLFPNAYLGAEMLKYSAWTIIFIILTQTINGALQGMGKVKTPVIAFGIGAVLKLLFNILLIPIYKVNGAAISSIICSFTIFLICFMELRKSISINFSIKKFLIKPIVSSIIMYIVSHTLFTKMYFIHSQNFKFIISITLGIIVYFFTIILLKIFTKEEIFMIPYGQKAYNKLKDKKAQNT